MFINENKINSIVEKNIRKLIKEDFYYGSRDGVDSSEETEDRRKPMLPKNSFSADKISNGAGLLAGMSGMGPVGVLAVLGLGAIGYKLGKNLIALNRVKKLEFPRTVSNAMEYAKFASAERNEAQELCKKLQQNLQNAISAFNKEYGQDLDTQNQQIFGGMETTFQDRGKTDRVSVDWDKDFSSVNAGQNESRIYESEIGDLNKKTSIISPSQFLSQMEAIDENEAIQSIIFPLRKEYTDAYGLWMQWTRYINVLVHAYEKQGLTWDVVINSYKESNPKDIVKDFIKNKLGVATNNDINSYKGKNKENRLIVRVKSTNYMLGKTPYTLLKDDTSPKYYALPQFTSIKGVVLTKEMPLNFNFKTNMVKRTLPTQDGKTVYLLSQEAINYIFPIMSGNQTRDF